MGKMSGYALKAAIKHGEELIEFGSISEAEKYFISRKDFLLDRLKAVSAQSSVFIPDYTVESLKELEKRYFDMYAEDAFDKAGTTRKDFESMMSVYWGAVAVKNNKDAKWAVEEYPFTRGKYEFFVNKGLLSLSIGDNFRDLYKRQNNKRRNLLFREYNKYFAK